VTTVPPAPATEQLRPAVTSAPADSRWVAVTAIVAGAVGVVLWLWPRGALWLDEAQSVAIARHSPAGMVDALRADGAPPLYYTLLHAWMWVVGDGTWAVRSLSAVFGAVAVAVTAVVARRLFGPVVGWIALGVMALHPFVARYASETRMYTLVMAEVAVGIVLVDDLLRTRRRRTWLALVVCTAALVLTHYWSLPVVAAAVVLAGGAHVVGVRRGRWSWEHRSPALLVATAVAGGFLATAAWWPTMHFQSVHTGTPWTRPASLWDALHIVVHWDRGSTWISTVATVLAVVLLIAGSVAPCAPVAPPAALTSRTISAHLWLSVGFAFVITHLSHSAFVSRYTAVLFPSTVLLISVAIGRVDRRARRAAVVVVLAVGWMAATAHETQQIRTRGAAFAAAIRTKATPGDLVLYCPDQLGPALFRVLDETPGLDLRQAVYPTGASPERVDWIDYRRRYEAADAGTFLAAELAAARPPAVWLVLSETYPPTQLACTELFVELAQSFGSGRQVIADDPHWRDHDQLWRFVP
jgi:mannosyltransferase